MSPTLRTLVAAFFLAFIALPAGALAQKASVTVQVIQASKKPGKTDKSLERFQDQLGDFAYKSYKLVDTKRTTVELGKTSTVTLPGKRKLDIHLRSIDKQGRARLKLSIPGVVDSTVAVRQGGDVVLGGPAMPHGDGVLFVPVTVTRITKK